MRSSGLYEQDFYAWAKEQAGLLRSGKIMFADVEHIAEEIESMGKSEKRELASRLEVLLTHLLKWRFQPERRGASWEDTINDQRDRIADHIDENPSLKPQTPDILARSYRYARKFAARETKSPLARFPAECPWSCAEVMASDFWPEAASEGGDETQS